MAVEANHTIVIMGVSLRGNLAAHLFERCAATVHKCGRYNGRGLVLCKCDVGQTFQGLHSVRLWTPTIFSVKLDAVHILF
jgi:hypothetical protein